MKNEFVELPFHVLSAKDIAVPSIDIDNVQIIELGDSKLESDLMFFMDLK